MRRRTAKTLAMVKAVSRTKLSFVAALSLASVGCVSHRHDVGMGATESSSVTVRQYYVLFGLLPYNDVDVRRMAGNVSSFSVETEYSAIDLLLAPLLLPLTATSRTVTVRT